MLRSRGRSGPLASAATATDARPGDSPRVQPGRAIAPPASGRRCRRSGPRRRARRASSVRPLERRRGAERAGRLDDELQPLPQVEHRPQQRRVVDRRHVGDVLAARAETSASRATVSARRRRRSSDCRPSAASWSGTSASHRRPPPARRRSRGSPAPARARRWRSPRAARRRRRARAGSRARRPPRTARARPCPVRR